MPRAIGKIPWSKLVSWYENSDRIPDAINKLKEKPTKAEAAELCKFLMDELEHQDGICQATAFATPFLIELLDEPSRTVTPKLLDVLWRCYHGAMFGANECDFKVGVDTVRNPEQYRGKAATLGDGTFNELLARNSGYTREEGFGWSVLVYTDLQNCRDTISKLTQRPEKAIREPAEFLLAHIDDYWGERQRIWDKVREAMTGKKKGGTKTAKKKKHTRKKVAKKKKKSTVSKKQSRGKHLVLSCELEMYNKKKVPVESIEDLKLLDGFFDRKSMVKSTPQLSWDGKPLTGGIVRCEFDDASEELRLVTDFGLPHNPSTTEIKCLKKACAEQWTEGVGKTAFEQFSDVTRYSVKARVTKITVVVDQKKPFEVNEKAKKRLGELKKDWKAVAKSNALSDKEKQKILERCFNAISKKNRKLLESLIKKNRLDVNALSTVFGIDTTLLIHASSKNFVPGAKLLLNLGADPNHSDSGGRVPLHFTHNAKIVAALLAHGANPNARSNPKATSWLINNESPLTSKSILTNPKCVQLLIDAGANVRLVGEQRKPPLYHAVSASLKSVQMLIENGARLSPGILSEAINPMPNRWRNPSKKEASEIVMLLIKLGAEPKVQHLMDATYLGSYELVDLFLKRKVPLNGKPVGKFGMFPQTPLNRAVMSRNLKMVKYLVDKGADPDLGKGFARPISVATAYGNLSVTKLLVSKGVSLAPVNRNKSLSQLAKQHHNKDVAAYLEKREEPVMEKRNATRKVSKKKQPSTKRNLEVE